MHVGRISILFAKVSIKFSIPSFASSSDIIITVQCERFNSFAFERFNIAKPRLNELQSTVAISLFILVPLPSDVSGFAICIVNFNSSFSDSDLSRPMAITYERVSTLRAS